MSIPALLVCLRPEVRPGWALAMQRKSRLVVAAGGIEDAELARRAVDVKLVKG